MNHIEVNHIPNGLKIIKNEEKSAILEYKSATKKSVSFLYYITIVFVIALLVFVIQINFPYIQLLTPINIIILLFISLVILGYISSKKWTRITINPDLIIIEGKSYNIKHAELRSSRDETEYDMYLKYGADIQLLPACLSDSLAIVNYINPIIISIGMGSSSSNNLDKGERIQIFE